MARVITKQYRDPLDAVWLKTAASIGLTVVRNDDAFASTDGSGTLTLATQQELDPDDCLAQMIFHEICHSLVAGPDAFSKRDWGMGDQDIENPEVERSTLRAQLHISRHYGLERFLAPTTDFREFYDTLLDPLSGTDPEINSARRAIQRSMKYPWAPHLHHALDATQKILRVTAGFSDPESMLQLSKEPTRKCRGCGWLREELCIAQDKPRSANDEACLSWETEVECESCGACCREAYHSVTLTPGDVAQTRHPRLVVLQNNYVEMKRNNGRCIALIGTSAKMNFACTIYVDRPTSCRDFELGGNHCITARRRVGRSI